MIKSLKYFALVIFVFPLLAFEDNTGCSFNSQQYFCYSFCKEQIQKTSKINTINNRNFYIIEDGGKLYCSCPIMMQLPTKLFPEKESP